MPVNRLWTRPKDRLICRSCLANNLKWLINLRKLQSVLGSFKSRKGLILARKYIVTDYWPNCTININKVPKIFNQKTFKLLLLINCQARSHCPSEILDICLTGVALVLLIRCENKKLRPSLDMVWLQGISFSNLRNIPLLPQSQRYLEKMEKPSLQSEVLKIWPIKHLHCVFNI